MSLQLSSVSLSYRMLSCWALWTANESSIRHRCALFTHSRRRGDMSDETRWWWTGEEKVEMFYRLSPDQPTDNNSSSGFKNFHYCISHRKSTLDVIIVIVDLMLIVWAILWCECALSDPIHIKLVVSIVDDWLQLLERWHVSQLKSEDGNSTLKLSTQWRILIFVGSRLLLNTIFTFFSRT